MPLIKDCLPSWHIFYILYAIKMQIAIGAHNIGFKAVNQTLGSLP